MSTQVTLPPPTQVEISVILKDLAGTETWPQRIATWLSEGAFFLIFDTMKEHSCTHYSQSLSALSGVEMSCVHFELSPLFDP